jgi:AAA+ superfamily predicted ATPase
MVGADAMIEAGKIPVEEVRYGIGSWRTGTAHAMVAAVRARARLRAAWMERMWSFGETSPDQGLAITPAEVKSILTEPYMEAQRYQVFLAEDGPSRLHERAFEADKELDRDAFFRHLAQVFGLTVAERNLLCVLVAVELEPRLERVLAYLADDTRATRPTRALVQELFTPADDAPETMAGLLRWRLATPLNGERGWQARTQWQLDEAVLLSVAAGKWVDPALAHAVKVVRPEDLGDLPCLYPEVLTQMLAEIPESEGGEACEVALTGPEGAGRETLAAQFAAARGRALISVKTSLLLGEKGGLDALVPAVRLARATGAELYWREAEGVTPADWDALRSLSRVSLRGTQMAPKSATHRFVLRPLTTATRAEAWAHWSSTPVSEMVRTQRLTPAEIKLAAQAGDEVAEKAAMRRSIAPEGELLHVLPCPYTWDDLVLPAQLRATLESLEAQVRLRWEVYEEWGFQRLTHLGQGISALFGGPSGTGKTMAAQVLARSLGLELYRVDLAGVVNKYIGETEKRLRDVFDACERSGALLFFDEADALFGSRMQVKDSHDRFANIEIDYLLQRIEQFDGIAILATNRKNDLDQAFLRRLRFVVDFLPPGEDERLQLWQKALPERAPGGEQIRGVVDFALLAEELEVNGAQIKGIALGAAFLARSEKTMIGMTQIVQAAQREYAKQNLRLRVPLGSVVTT